MFENARVVELLQEPGMTCFQLAQKVQCFKRDEDALRIIDAGGFYINYQKVTNINEAIVPGIHVLPNNLTILRTGKKTYHIVKWV